MFKQFKSFLDLAEIGHSRSSITNPLQWTLVILLGGIALMMLVHAPIWIVQMLAVGVVVILLVFVGACLYFMRIQPDLLRSEAFNLSKMAIERGLIGDSISGLVKNGQSGETLLDGNNLLGPGEQGR